METQTHTHINVNAVLFIVGHIYTETTQQLLLLILSANTAIRRIASFRWRGVCSSPAAQRATPM